MEPDELKMPFSESGEKPSRFKRPQLSDEHINDIAALSSIYLKSNTVEFSEEDLLSNLKLLQELSAAGSQKIPKNHANQIAKIVSIVFSASAKVSAPKKPGLRLGQKFEILSQENIKLNKQLNDYRQNIADMNGKANNLAFQLEATKKQLIHLSGKHESEKGFLRREYESKIQDLNGKIKSNADSISSLERVNSGQMTTIKNAIAKLEQADLFSRKSLQTAIDDLKKVNKNKKL